MFKFVENNKVVIQIILGAVALTFVGFGVSSYSSMAEDPYLVKVGSAKITLRDLDRELEGQPVDAAARQQALQGLIQRNLLLAESNGFGLTVSTDQLQQAIEAIPQFQDNGQFSLDKYKAFLAERQMTGPIFEERISRDLLMRAQVAPFTVGQFTSRALTDRLVSILGESRAVSAMVLSPQAFASQVKTDDATVAAYYKANAQRYVAPEAVRLDYVVLSQDRLGQSLSVSDDEAHKYYDQHQAEFGKEQRRASHILLAVPQGASAQDQARVKAQAEDLLKQLRANPSSFEQLARTRSQDPGSAAKGGDLGFNPQGAMVKPFDNAVFSMKPGQISGIVQTQFGFHIIRLDAVRKPSFDDVKSQVVMRLQQQKSAAQFRADVDTLTEVAYQQGDSLKGVQDALKLVPQQSGWLTHDKAGNDPILSNPKVLAAAFSKDVLVKKHNSEPIDLGNNTMVVVRVLDHQPQHQLKLDEVKDAIKAELVSVEGAKLAAQRGQSMLDALKTGKPTGAQSWSPAHTVSRQSASGLPAADLRAIFSAGVAKLPAFAGVKHDNGEYVLYRVEQVIAAPAATPEQRLQLAGVVGEMGANVQAMAYLNGLRQKYPIKGGTQTINQEDQ